MHFDCASSSNSYLGFATAGYGGGFNERSSVEYIHRDESDDEYDEV